MKNKKSKGIAELPLLAIIVLAAVVIAGGNTQSFVGLGSGFTVNSISTSSIVSPSTDLTTLNWLVDTTLNGGGQSVVYTVTPEQTKSMSGYESQYPFTMEADALKQTVTYSVTQSNTPLTNAKVYVNEDYRLTASVCPSGTTYQIKINSYQAYCVIYENIGVKGFLTKSSTSSEVELSLTTTNPSKTNILKKTISSTSPSVNFNDPVTNQLYATAQITGNLVSGTESPDANLYTPIYSDVIGDIGAQNLWHLVSPDKWNAYQSQYSSSDTELRNLITYNDPTGATWQSTRNKINDYINRINARVTDLELEQLNIGGYSTIKVSQDQQTGAAFKIDISNNLALNPRLLFKIRADWIGIKIPTAQPSIISAGSSPFESGKSGSIILSVRNTGTNPATFFAEFPSCYPFTQTNTAQNAYFGAGETKQMDIPITTTWSDSISRSCSVLVRDYNNPSNFASTNVVVSQTNVVIPSTTTTIPSTPPTITPPQTCTKENQNVGGIFGIGKTPCCAIAEDGVTKLVEKNKVCVREQPFPLFDIVMVLAVIGALIFVSVKK